MWNTQKRDGVRLYLQSRCETIVTVRTVTIVSHRPRFCRQTFELDSGDPSETFALVLRGRADRLKRSSLIERNSADFGVIGGLSAVITVITVTFAIESVDVARAEWGVTRGSVVDNLVRFASD